MILIVWILALAITCPPILGILSNFFLNFFLISHESRHNGKRHWIHKFIFPSFSLSSSCGAGFMLILGWYEPGRRDLLECRYNENKGYVVFSAMGMKQWIMTSRIIQMPIRKFFSSFRAHRRIHEKNPFITHSYWYSPQGSFFLPMLVMVYVYLRISCVVANRHDDMVQIKVHQVSIHCWITLQQIKFRVYTAGLSAHYWHKLKANSLWCVGQWWRKSAHELFIWKKALQQSIVISSICNHSLARIYVLQSS